MKKNQNTKTFFALVRTGLWEDREVNGEGLMDSGLPLTSSASVDWRKVYRMAEEQSVVGLVAAGLERVKDVKVPQGQVLTFVSRTLQMEQRNLAMNEFVAMLISDLREKNIYALLVKGQGIAQCYERPLWRAAGDVDLLLSDEGYEKAKELLIPQATNVEQEYTFFKHQALTIDGWEVELHGSLYSRLSRRIDRMIDEVQKDVFYGGNVRSWQNGKTQIFLPAPDNDVIFVFTHIMHHFFFEGVGLRQICDWCRLLWKYRDSLNHGLLEQRIRKMGLMTEWKAFAAFAIKYLGMPADAMPLYSGHACRNRKADKICAFVLKVGNFGHKQTSAMNANQPYLLRKFISFWVHAGFTLRHFMIFPMDSIFFFGQVFRSGLHAAVRGE